MKENPSYEERVEAAAKAINPSFPDRVVAAVMLQAAGLPALLEEVEQGRATAGFTLDMIERWHAGFLPETEHYYAVRDGLRALANQEENPALQTNQESG